MTKALWRKLQLAASTLVSTPDLIFPAAALLGAVFPFLILSTTLSAATTTTWEMNTYQDFLKGRFDGVSLDRDGRLKLAPKLETFFSSGQPVIWSIAQELPGVDR